MENHSISLNERVQKIKNNKEEIERLIDEYKPFIASVAQSTTGKFMRYGEDDELSIGLIAFEESIRAYDSCKGNFLSFSKNVIKRRLIDYYRKESRHQNVLPLEQGGAIDDEDEVDLTRDEAIKQFSESQVIETRRMEIEDLKKELEEWGISFFEVAKSSPKHERTRNICMQIVDAILQHTDIVNLMKNKKYLPIAEIEKITQLPRKNIERARNYIIAVVLIRDGDYQYINNFVERR